MLRSFQIHKSENKTVITYRQGFWTFSVSSLVALFLYIFPPLCFFIFVADPFSGSWPHKAVEPLTLVSEILLVVSIAVWALRRYFRNPEWQVEIAHEDAGRVVVRCGSTQLVQPAGLFMTIRSTGEDLPADSEHNPGFWAEIKITGAAPPPLYLRTAMSFPSTAHREGTELMSILTGELNAPG